MTCEIKCTNCGRDKWGPGTGNMTIYGASLCMACMAAEGRKEYVEPEQSIRRDIEAGCYPFNYQGYAQVPLQDGEIATIAVTRSPAVPGWSCRAGSHSLYGWYPYQGRTHFGTWLTDCGTYTSGWGDKKLMPPTHPPGTHAKPAGIVPFTENYRPHSVEDHIIAAGYPVNEFGQALVPMRGGGVATICATDCPVYGSLLGWRTGERCATSWFWDSHGRSYDTGWCEGKWDLQMPDGGLLVNTPAADSDAKKAGGFFSRLFA